MGWGGASVDSTRQMSASSAEVERQFLTEEQVHGTADAVGVTKGPHCASVALRSSGQAHEFRTDTLPRCISLAAAARSWLLPDCPEWATGRRGRLQCMLFLPSGVRSRRASARKV